MEENENKGHITIMDIKDSPAVGIVFKNGATTEQFMDGRVVLIVEKEAIPCLIGLLNEWKKVTQERIKETNDQSN
jgi:hypothetical protein